MKFGTSRLIRANFNSFRLVSVDERMSTGKSDGIRESRPGGTRIYVSESVGPKDSNGWGQAISAVHSFPEVMVNRKLCSLMIAATRLKPSPSPPSVRLLSER
jgi:hypothetical protein